MAKEKKSFFERLTGVSRPPDGELLETTEDTIIEEEENEGELTVDVYQTGSEIVVKAMVAGVKPEDLDILITRDMVTIKGRREAERTISDDNYFFKELYWGSFSRTIVLPQEVLPEEAEATERHGLITIKLPKVDKGKQTKLRVKSNQ